MDTTFASHNGGVVSTAVVDRELFGAEASAGQPPVTSTAPKVAKLGGQLGRIASAINTVGWNHHQVPPAERLIP